MAAGDVVGSAGDVSLRTTLLVAGAAGLVGLLLLSGVEPVADALDAEPGLVEYTALPLLWNVATLGVLLRVASRAQLVGWWRRTHDEGPPEHPWLLWFGVVTMAAIGVSSLRLWLVDEGWQLLAGPVWSINSPDANRGSIGFEIGAGLLLYQLLVRIPFTVFVEESLFRGWVHDRHGALASGVLFAAYHLPQWWTIPALIPFGLSLALLRTATRSLWPGAVFHTAGNVVYAFTLLSSA